MLHEEHTVKLAIENGLVAKMINKSEIKQLEPDVEIDSIGGAYFKCDHHSTPDEFMSVLKEFLLRKGVRIFKNTLVDNFVLEGEKIKGIFSSFSICYECCNKQETRRKITSHQDHYCKIDFKN